MYVVVGLKTSNLKLSGCMHCQAESWSDGNKLLLEVAF